ncbi:MAG: COG1361 family protein [Minisyncoccota bacterium]
MSSEFKKSIKSKLDRMSEKLYSRTKYRAPEDNRESINPIESEPAPQSWESPDIDELLMSDRRSEEKYPLIKKVFTVSVLFFVCAAIAAALIYFKGDNFISTRNLDIVIDGPVSVSAGSSVDLLITITNKNNASLDRVNLNIVYPDGTRDAENTTEVLNNRREELEEIGPGQKITKNERAVFLGTEGEVKKVRVSVDYGVKGSNATFTKDKVFELVIGSAPVSVTITRPDAVDSGETFTTTLSINANSEEVLRNVLLKAEYPYGWSLASADPAPIDKNKSIWMLGDLSPGEKKTITLRGVLLGEDNEERTFRFFVGAAKGGEPILDTTLSSDSMVVEIKKPTIDLDVLLNGDPSDEYIAPAGENIRSTVNFKNNLSTNLINPQIEVRLTGSALDRGSVVPQAGGFYNSADNSILWNSTNYSELNTLAPGDSSSVGFSFESLGNMPAGTANQTISMLVTLIGRQQDTNTEIRISETRTIKIASVVTLTSNSLYSMGPFGNSGEIPPVAEKPTTYTIALALGNTQNDIDDAMVTGTLGPNVTWLGGISPEDEEVTYDEATRVVTWNIGTLQSGAGFSRDAEEVFIRVSLTPSLGQVGGVPVLLSNVSFSGIDEFTELPIRVTNPAVTTRISTDSSYVQGDETVVK